MNITAATPDSAVLTELGARLRRRRIDLDLTQSALAREAGVSKRTVERAELGSSVQLSRLIRLLRALDLLAGLDALIPPSRPRPMDHLRRAGKPRQRSRRRKPPAPREQPWTWGDDA